MNRMVERVKQEVRVQQALETGNGLLSSALQYKIAENPKPSRHLEYPPYMRFTDGLETEDARRRTMQYNQWPRMALKDIPPDTVEKWMGRPDEALAMWRMFGDRKNTKPPRVPVLDAEEKMKYYPHFFKEDSPSKHRIPDILRDPNERGDMEAMQRRLERSLKALADRKQTKDLPKPEEEEEAKKDVILARIEKLMGKVPGGATTVEAAGVLDGIGDWKEDKARTSRAMDESFKLVGIDRNQMFDPYRIPTRPPYRIPTLPDKRKGVKDDKPLARIEKLMGKVPGGATTVGAAGGATVGGGAGYALGSAFDEKGSRRKAIAGMLAGMLAGGAAGGYAGSKYKA